MDSDTEQIDSGRAQPTLASTSEGIWTDRYRIVPAGPWQHLQRRSWDGEWHDRYRFTLTPRAWDQFAPMCHYHQTALESGFTRNRTCTIATPDGRVTVGESRLIVTTGTVREETAFADSAERSAALRTYCGIELPEAATSAASIM